ncbi:MAG: hypothetical protein KDA90_20890 [Planctomycetaceae bacterium]|nr:hypothetical protein [Planctomycetaceae bacterium]
MDHLEFQDIVQDITLSKDGLRAIGVSDKKAKEIESKFNKTKNKYTKLSEVLKAVSTLSNEVSTWRKFAIAFLKVAGKNATRPQATKDLPTERKRWLEERRNLESLLIEAKDSVVYEGDLRIEKQLDDVRADLDCDTLLRNTTDLTDFKLFFEAGHDILYRAAKISLNSRQNQGGRKAFLDRLDPKAFPALLAEIDRHGRIVAFADNANESNQYDLMRQSMLVLWGYVYLASNEIWKCRVHPAVDKDVMRTSMAKIVTELAYISRSKLIYWMTEALDKVLDELPADQQNPSGKPRKRTSDNSPSEADENHSKKPKPEIPSDKPTVDREPQPPHSVEQKADVAKRLWDPVEQERSQLTQRNIHLVSEVCVELAHVENEKTGNPQLGIVAAEKAWSKEQERSTLPSLKYIEFEAYYLTEVLNLDSETARKKSLVPCSEKGGAIRKRSSRAGIKINKFIDLHMQDAMEFPWLVRGESIQAYTFVRRCHVTVSIAARLIRGFGIDRAKERAMEYLQGKVPFDGMAFLQVEALHLHYGLRLNNREAGMKSLDPCSEAEFGERLRSATGQIQ